MHGTKSDKSYKLKLYNILYIGRGQISNQANMDTF